MSNLSNPDEIWKLKATDDDLKVGAKYASLTLPWTFNRMMLNTSSAGQQLRGINIAKGIVGQEILKRALKKNKISAKAQRKSHRDNDLFDFKITVGGKDMDLDLKSIHFFTNYPGVDRDKLSAQLIIDNLSYGGPDWRRFFPMLVPHTQIGQSKDAYCFAIASSIDPRADTHTNRNNFALTAFPYGKHLPFLSSKKLCLYREEADCIFRLIPATNSAPFRPPIPEHSGHLFRSIPATL